MVVVLLALILFAVLTRFRKDFAAVFIFFCLSYPAESQTIVPKFYLNVTKFDRDNAAKIPIVLYTLKNDTGLDLNTVMISCTALTENGDPEEVIKDIQSNVGTGKAVYGQVAFMTPVKNAASVSCRVTDAF